MNATTAKPQGLSAANQVLRHEDQEEFDILLACLNDEFQPANQHESFLVEHMAQSRWRLSRVRRLETAAFDQMLSADAPLGAQFLQGPGRALSILQRLASAAERSYYMAHAELLKSRQLRNEAKTVAAIDNAIAGCAVNFPPPQIPNEPKSQPKFYTAPGKNLALRL